MSQQIINIGTAPGDATGDPAYIAFGKCNANFTEVYNDVQASLPLGNAIEYKFNGSTTEPPASGEIRFDNATQASALKLWASQTTSAGINIKQFLSMAISGSQLVLQDKNDNTNYVKFNVTGAPVDKTTYWEFPVASFASGGSLPSAAVLVAVTPAISGGSGGNVSNVGTPTNGQLAQWTDATHIQGIAASSLGFAPLASPLFTGDPQAPTPASADNDTSIATTAFVKAQGYLTTVTVTIGTTPISGGTTGRYLYDNAGIFGEKTPTQLTADLDLFTSTLKGLTPLSGGGTTNFLRADGTWAAPPGGGGASVTISDTAPASPSVGNLWWDSVGAQMYIWYTDPNTSQWVPTINAAPGISGALVNLQNLTAASSASLVFTLPSGYKRFKLMMEGIKAAASSQVLLLQVSEDGGSTWKTAATYLSQSAYGAGTSLSGYWNNAASGVLLANAFDLSTVNAMTGEVLIPAAVPSGQYTMISFKADMNFPVANGLYTISGAGMWTGDTGAINAIRLIMTSGNILSGTASLYGIV